MTYIRSGFSGAVLKLPLYILLFLLLVSPQLPGKSHPKTKVRQKISIGNNSSKQKLALKVTSPKVNSQKNAPREITVVIENYPPNCYIENVPQIIELNEFKLSVLKKILEKAQKDFLLSVYHFDRKSGTFCLKGNLDKGSLDKIKDILFSIGFLRASGFEVEIAQAVFSSMGVQPVYREYPWARCIEMMKSGTSDAIFTIFKNSDRLKYLYYPSEPTILEPNVLFKLKESRLTFDGDLKKLKNYVIGVKTSTSYGAKFDQAKYLKKEEVSFTESVIRLVENKRVDLGVGSALLLKYLMKNKGNTDKFIILQPNISQEPLYIAFSKARQQKKLSEEFSLKLSKFKKTEKYRKILKKYGIINQ